MSEKSFEAGRYLTKVNGREYLEVKWRLLWLRTEHPEAVVSTELARLENDEAVFKARVAIPGGGEATGWGSEGAVSFPDFIEKAETRALGRALAALGYGTQFCEEFEAGPPAETAGNPADTPVKPPARERGQAPPHVTQAQLQAIYSIARSQGLAQEEVERRCVSTRHCSVEQLGRKEASQFIDELKANR